MAAELLQKMRDIHVPDAPSWWPPAPGWWLLGLLLAGACGWLVWRGLAVQRRRRPLRRARHLYAEIYERYRHGELSSRDYLNESNELIKRLLIHGLGEQQARRASGREWLELLDQHTQPGAFTAGAGQALGDARFRPELDIDVAAVHQRVEQLLHQAAPAPGERAP